MKELLESIPAFAQEISLVNVHLDNILSSCSLGFIVFRNPLAKAIAHQYTKMWF